MDELSCPYCGSRDLVDFQGERFQCLHCWYTWDEVNIDERTQTSRERMVREKEPGPNVEGATTC